MNLKEFYCPICKIRMPLNLTIYNGTDNYFCEKNHCLVMFDQSTNKIIYISFSLNGTTIVYNNDIEHIKMYNSKWFESNYNPDIFVNDFIINKVNLQYFQEEILFL